MTLADSDKKREQIKTFAHMRFYLKYELWAPWSMITSVKCVGSVVNNFISETRLFFVIVSPCVVMICLVQVNPQALKLQVES